MSENSQIGCNSLTIYPGYVGLEGTHSIAAVGLVRFQIFDERI